MLEHLKSKKRGRQETVIYTERGREREGETVKGSERKKRE